MMKIKRVYLIGFMGCGKSTVGKSLASLMKWRFIDLDEHISAKEGKSIPAIFEEHGEAYFREMENQAIKDVSELEKVIIATGGGAPCFANNMKLMKNSGLTIYLKLSPEGLMNRLILAKSNRPLIAGKSDEELFKFIQNKLAEREPVYMQAQTIADATTVGPESYLKIIRMYEQNN